MAEGEIPINPGDLPIDSISLDDSLVYAVSLVKGIVNPKADKSGFIFCKLQYEVAEGDYEGMTVMQNWLRLPVALTANPSKKELVQKTNMNAPFGRFCRAFRITHVMPPVRLEDRESIEAWQEWIEKAYGNIGKVTIQNQEFPEGSGRMRSGIADFVV